MVTRSDDRAVLYRMATPDHICPFGLKSKALLERRGFDVEDHVLSSAQQAQAFKESMGVETTPQVFIDQERIGGYEDLRRHFSLEVRDGDQKTYRPVIAIFALAALLGVAIQWRTAGVIAGGPFLMSFIGSAMVLLALQKLRDLPSFTNSFLGYDLLARRAVRYAYVYPFAEAGAGLLMVAGALPFVSAPIALLIGTVGAISVIKAVWIDDRDLACACVGGDSNVPLGAVSLAENLMMAGAGAWMLAG